MAEDSREKLESESNELTARYERVLAEAKSFVADFNSEDQALQKLAEREISYTKNDKVIAEKAHDFDFDTMSKELKQAKNFKDFSNKKATFLKDLGEADKAMRNSPKLIDDWEAHLKSRKSENKSLRVRDTTLIDIFKKSSDDAQKLNAHIKEFNDSWSVPKNKEIPLVRVPPPQMDFIPLLDERLTILEGHESRIDQSKKGLKNSEKNLKETTAKLGKLAFAAKAGKK